MPSMSRMINGLRGRGRPPMIDDDGRIALLQALTMGARIKDLAEQRGVSRQAIWRRIAEARALVVERRIEPWYSAHAERSREG